MEPHMNLYDACTPESVEHKLTVCRAANQPTLAEDVRLFDAEQSAKNFADTTSVAETDPMRCKCASEDFSTLSFLRPRFRC